jgi:hypothetical protein
MHTRLSWCLCFELASTSKFVCVRSKFGCCAQWAQDILVRVERPYIQSSVAHTIDIFLHNARSCGYKRAREGVVPKSPMRSKL